MSLFEKFQLAFANDKILLILIAMGEGTGRATLLQYLNQIDLRDGDGKAFVVKTIDSALKRLREDELVYQDKSSAYFCVKEIENDVLAAAIAERALFEKLLSVIVGNIQITWQKRPLLKGASHGLKLLRLHILLGYELAKLELWISGCKSYSISDPLLEACGLPMNTFVWQHAHAAVKEVVLVQLLANNMSDMSKMTSLLAFVEAYLQDQSPSDNLSSLIAQYYLLAGKLDNALAVIQHNQQATAHFVRGAVWLLRGELGQTITGFEAALKLLRKETGKRNVVVTPLLNTFYILAMLRSSDPKVRKNADTYLDVALREDAMNDGLYERLKDVSRKDGQNALKYNVSGVPIIRLVHGLMLYWLGMEVNQYVRANLVELIQKTDAVGWHFFSTQAACLLARLGEVGYIERAPALCKQYALSDMTTWFERQEAWQRQLNALIELRGTGLASSEVYSGQDIRLVWALTFNEKYGIGSITPREQKRSAKGVWSEGRNVALKRLYNEASSMDFLTEQDKNVARSIVYINEYYNTRYELKENEAILKLIGHPLLFWDDAMTVRLELLKGEPELLIKQQGDRLLFTLEPNIGNEFVVRKETPTRLRIYSMNAEQQNIKKIIGAGLTVPKEAKQLVFQAIEAVSGVLTVQSDIGGVASNVEQIVCDTRLHVHLLPYQTGLKVQVLVCPLPEGGPYYPPGQGSESVIAEINGKPLQTQRQLKQEKQSYQQFMTQCTALKAAESNHGEWLLAEPVLCLELLSELQQYENLVIAWPEGQKFKLMHAKGSKQFRMSIKGERDWFSASGELKIDDDKILELRQLLELVQTSPSRFVALGNNEFLALTEEFRRRLADLASFADYHGKKGVRVHPLASFALEELSNDATIKADTAWKEHLAKLRDLDAYQPRLPNTLQVQLRDYQLAGFEWLSRLAYWGVGACLADDMGLGKTLQALSLIVSRAPNGPTMVVAPTSVCPNWFGEAVRFAPTLKPVIFGSGDRKAALSALQPFDLVIVSYGLLQQEAELFAEIQWHTIVLDEAQAIKNAQTKRSQAVMSLKGDFRMIATGTPLENHLGELWNLYRFINPGLLGSLEQFNERFANIIERSNEQDKAVARHRLRRLIQPFMLRRIKSQVLTELPSRTEITLPVELSSEEAALYEVLRQKALEQLLTKDMPAGERSLQILAEIMKLRRMCCNAQLVNPELALPSSKLAVFAELVDNLLENKHKILVFSQFVDHLTLIRAHLDSRGIHYQYLDGSTSMADRKTRVDAFQAGQGDIFLISLKAGGMGINLTAADYVIHMDPWWNPAVEDQASDRAHRMGQLRPVTIYRLVAKNTIEERIVDLHKHKRDLADSLLEGSDMSAKMSANEMLGLLQEGMAG